MTGRPERKPNRLKGFDHSTPTAYFVTLCTQGRRCLLSTIDGATTIVGASTARPPSCTLTNAGRIVDAAIQAITQHYPHVQVDKYVIMPNHVHLIIRICAAAGGRAMLAPTSALDQVEHASSTASVSIPKIVQHLKGIVTKHLGFSLWQKSFHDNIIRNEDEYHLIWEYIDTNPLRWTEDCFYSPERKSSKARKPCCFSYAVIP